MSCQGLISLPAASPRRYIPDTRHPASTACMLGRLPLPLCSRTRSNGFRETVRASAGSGSARTLLLGEYPELQAVGRSLRAREPSLCPAWLSYEQRGSFLAARAPQQAALRSAPPTQVPAPGRAGAPAPPWCSCCPGPCWQRAPAAARGARPTWGGLPARERASC